MFSLAATERVQVELGNLLLLIQEEARYRLDPYRCMLLPCSRNELRRGESDVGNMYCVAKITLLIRLCFLEFILLVDTSTTEPMPAPD
jgi:hypothetical protein